MRACVAGVAVLLLAGAVCGVALALEGGQQQPAPQYNPDPVAEFGTAKSEPIDTGFFFFDGKYIEAPYVVERRGLDTYINDCLVRKGPEWPPYDYRVNEDPGEPPADESPLGPVPKGVDPRDTYWARKVRYLWQHYDEATAREMLIAAYKASPAVTEVAQDPETGLPRVTDKYGKSSLMAMGVFPSHLVGPPSRQEYLDAVEREREHWRWMLKRPTMALFVKGGMSSAWHGAAGLEVVGVLASNKSPDEKMAELRQIGVISAHDRDLEAMYRSVVPSQQMVTRCEAARQAGDRPAAAPPAQGGSKPQYNPDPVAEFGTAKSEPINTGFFFFDGKYIEAPYVVERKGLSIYINECCVSKGSEWPPYDWRVSEDPGDPPADESPLGPFPEGVDRRDTYWARKARYLCQHYEKSRAMELLIDAYRASHAVLDVTLDEQTGFPRVTDKHGKAALVGFTSEPDTSDATMSREGCLRSAELERDSAMRGLKAGKVIIVTGSMSVEASGKRAAQVVGALVDHPKVEERIAALKNAGLIPEGNAGVESMFRSLTFSTQLATRYEAVKASEQSAR